MKTPSILVSVFVLLSIHALAQTGSPDSVFLARTMREQRIRYHNDIASNSSLNNGSLYKEGIYKTKKGEVPYFLSDDWIESSLVYGGQVYEPIDLQYDLVNNKIISHPFYSLIKMELVYERIDRFRLGNHVFVRIKELPNDNNFYDRLVDGDVTLYALRKLEVVEELTSGAVTHLFVDKTKFFIDYNKRLIEVKGRKDLLKAFVSHKAQLKKQLPGGSAFRKDPEGSLKKSVSYINSELLK